MNSPTFLYHQLCPTGKKFDADDAEVMAEAEKDGWVDSPAKINQEAPKKRGRKPKAETEPAGE